MTSHGAPGHATPGSALLLPATTGSTAAASLCQGAARHRVVVAAADACWLLNWSVLTHGHDVLRAPCVIRPASMPCRSFGPPHGRAPRDGPRDGPRHDRSSSGPPRSYSDAEQIPEPPPRRVGHTSHLTACWSDIVVFRTRTSAVHASTGLVGVVLTPLLLDTDSNTARVSFMLSIAWPIVALPPVQLSDAGPGLQAGTPPKAAPVRGGGLSSSNTLAAEAARHLRELKAREAEAARRSSEHLRAMEDGLDRSPGASADPRHIPAVL